MYRVTLELVNPSVNKSISDINSESGTVIATGRNRAFKLSGSSVRPAYPGFIVMKKPQLRSSFISRPR